MRRARVATLRDDRGDDMSVRPRYSMLLIEWDADVPVDEIRRLSNAWGLKIREKSPVANVIYDGPLPAPVADTTEATTT